MAAAPAYPDHYREIVLDEVDSTNEEAWRRIEDGAGHGTVIRAGLQNRGRGRVGRTWDSPPGNLHMSIVAAAPRGRRAAQLSFVAALAAGDAIASDLPDDGRLAYKWPNDILIGVAKAGGILIEGRGGSDYVVGIGINVVSAPQDLGRPATCLADEGADGVTAAALAASVASAFEAWYGTWRDDGFASLRTAWLARAAGLGGTVEVRLPDRTLSGIFEGLNDGGALMLRLPGGRVEPIDAGEVFLIRTTG